jgi:cation:H+ antiporter
MYMDYVLLLIGFALLVKGADFFVDGAASLARKLGVSAAIVGLTIVAMGTSAPEAAVSITAGIQGSNEIAVGNILGSNLFNLIFILGICMMIKPIPTATCTLKRDFPWAIGSTILFIPMIADGKLSLLEGIILLVLFAAYIGWMIYQSVKNRIKVEDETKQMPLYKSIILLVVGLAMIILGGQFVVNSATNIAEAFGMSQTLIGLTICAIGTSLPELVTSVVAARKGESELAVGNVIGSNIFNLLFILGSTVVIHPFGVESVMLVDTIILLAATLLMMVFSVTKRQCTRGEGIVSLTVYLGYTAYIICRAYGLI